MTLLNKKGVSVINRHTPQKVNNRPYEELTVVKKVDDFVLLMRNVAIETKVMENNAVWRFKTYESFQKKVHLVAEDYTGGVDENNICIESPIIMDVLDENGEPEADAKVIVSFAAKIPTNIGRKELQ